MSGALLDRLRSSLEGSGLLPPGCRVLVGYSGGADSTCLLHALHRLGWDVVAAHLHHGQRLEADDEQERCRGFCASLDVPFATGRADVPRMAEHLKVGLEEAGRNARYSFFESAAHRLSCDRIATAHTRDDHVETVLLNLARGTGLHGLAGIPEARGAIVRPLLGVSRADTREYCRAEGLWFHDDPANADLGFARARVRQCVIPEFRTINPQFDAAVCRLAETAGEEDRFLDSASAAALESCELRPNGDLTFLSADSEVVLSRSKIESLPAVLVRRAIRLVASVLGAELDYEQTRLFVHGLASGGVGSLTAGGGRVAIEWSSERVCARDLEPASPFTVPIQVPGETVSERLGWAFESAPCPAEGFERGRGGLEAVVDLRNLETPLVARNRAEGDAMRPLGMAGRKKLGDLLGEAGLTVACRARLPILCDQAGPIWVPGVALADRVKIRDRSTEALRVRFREVAPVGGP